MRWLDGITDSMDTRIVAHALLRQTDYRGSGCGQKVISNQEKFRTMDKKIIVKMKKEVREKIIEICNRFNNNPGELINVLHQTQDFLGYLPAEAQELIAECLHIPTAKVYGVVSFYAFFTMTPKGKYPISVCLGTACYVRGAEKILDAFKKELNLEVGQTTPDGLFSLTCLRCVGACGLAPVAMVGDKVYGRLTPADIKGIVDEYRNME